MRSPDVGPRFKGSYYKSPIVRGPNVDPKVEGF